MDQQLQNAVAYYVASRGQVGTAKAMRHTIQRFGFTATEVREALEAKGLLLRNPSREAVVAEWSALNEAI
jgi:DNA-binding GntR family transcriptional regulator